MIVKARNKRPIISFEFGKSTGEIKMGSPVKVCVNNLFNTSVFESIIKPIADVTIVKETEFLYSVTPTDVGIFNITLELTNSQTGKIIKSNTIKLNSI